VALYLPILGNAHVVFHLSRRAAVMKGAAMETERTVPGSKFYITWILLSALGYFLGFFAGFLLGHLFLSNVMVGIAMGGIVCAFQRLALRRHVSRTVWWIPAGVIGMCIGYLLLAVFTMLRDYPFDLGWPHGALGYVGAQFVGGAITGMVQRRVLADGTGRAGAWIWISAIGWGTSVFGYVIIPLERVGGAWQNVLVLVASGIVGGIFLGAVTGAGLLRLLRPPTRSDCQS
jgi:hypothetical protein